MLHSLTRCEGGRLECAKGVRRERANLFARTKRDAYNLGQRVIGQLGISTDGFSAVFFVRCLDALGLNELNFLL
jgi:hypothetical protein